MQIRQLLRKYVFYKGHGFQNRFSPHARKREAWQFEAFCFKHLSNTLLRRNQQCGKSKDSWQLPQESLLEVELRKKFIRRFSPFIALALSLQKQFYKFSEFENRPFYRYGGYIEFTRFKEYYVMPRGHSLSIHARFSEKRRTSPYNSREKGDHYYIQTRHNDLFPLQSFSSKT